MIVPGIFELLEKVAMPVLDAVKPELSGNIITSLLSGKGVSGVMDAIEGTMGKLEVTKKAQIQAEVSTLLAQANLEAVEVISPKPWYQVPHEIAEMFADAYLATGFVIGIAHMTAWAFGYNIPFIGYDNVTVGIALSFSGLIKTYKSLMQ